MLKSFQESWHKLGTFLCEFFCGFGHCVFSWLWEEFSDRFCNAKCSKNLKQNSQNLSKTLPKSSENGVKMGSKSVFKSVPRRSAFWKRFRSNFEAQVEAKLDSCWRHFRNFFELFEFPRPSLKEVRFRDDFEAIWEPLGEAKPSISLQRGCKNQVFHMSHGGIDFGAILGAKMAPKRMPRGFQTHLEAMLKLSSKSMSKTVPT